MGGWKTRRPHNSFRGMSIGRRHGFATLLMAIQQAVCLGAPVAAACAQTISPRIGRQLESPSLSQRYSGFGALRRLDTTFAGPQARELLRQLLDRESALFYDRMESRPDS